VPFCGENMESNALWFDEMNISPSEKSRRVDMANQLEHGIKSVFDWYGGYEFDFVMWMEMENRLFN
jgi:hypothetical protein